MTGTELINGVAKLEKYYQKEMPQYEKDIWYKELGRMRVERFNQLIEKAYTECKFMPKLADILEINQKIPYIDKENNENKTVQCGRCHSSGIIMYTKLIEKMKYDFAARCTCENGNRFIWGDGKHYLPTIAELGM